VAVKAGAVLPAALPALAFARTTGTLSAAKRTSECVTNSSDEASPMGIGNHMQLLLVCLDPRSVTRDVVRWMRRSTHGELRRWNERISM
jgi:hypothetical protein